MKEEFFNSIKVLSYFLWEYTKNENALKLWCCAEDIVCFLAQIGIKTKDDFMDIISMDKTSAEYKNFMRQISYKIYEYTNDSQEQKNWYISEKLTRNCECITACVTAASIIGSANKGDEIYKTIRSQNARSYVSEK